MQERVNSSSETNLIKANNSPYSAYDDYEEEKKESRSLLKNLTSSRFYEEI